MELPKKYKHNDTEEKWRQSWDDQQVYAWDSTQPRAKTFAIDTPPPTVSGSLHIGHVFSYTHTDAIARYQRMTGKNIFYPMGWDDNGLPTERRVQNVYGIKCDPTIAYDPAFKPDSNHKRKPHEFIAVSRKNFIEICQQLTLEDEKVFEHLWRKLGLSVDWSLTYATIDAHCRKISQQSFLDCVDKQKVKHIEAPGMWDVDFQTAVAQAEVEDREKPGAYHNIRFETEQGQEFVIATTRPELLPACIAVVAHPEDKRYQDLFNSYAITPLFQAKVPILPSTHADPEKGSGILMVCTFGDTEDVNWWKQSSLPLKQIIGRDGCLLPVTFGEAPFESTQSSQAQQYYNQLVGLRVKKAQQRIVELLKQPQSNVSGTLSALVGEPEPIMHPVKFYEKGDTPIELIPTRQWFIDILSDKADLLAQGEKINWQPPYMKTRYTNWVEGLNQDWCISRQRFFGVPFPVWYPLNEQGHPQFDSPIYAAVDSLPIDPLISCPIGYTNAQRNQPNGFTGDPDVMDTWATSSLTPQLMSHWPSNSTRHDSVFPMDIRPQSHEIIRTWAFYTIVKAYIHSNTIPWKNVTISGWVLDPNRKKMSKSKGNVVTPEHLLDQYSSDAIRYWACKARLGTDTAFDETAFAIGQKLITKCFNAAKFVLIQTQDAGDLTIEHITQPLDIDWITTVNVAITKATKAFEQFDYAAALDTTETIFWEFCDHYIELVKGRAYREENQTKRLSACATLNTTLSIILRLLAPALPYITEEIWSWKFAQQQQQQSIHQAQWPTPIELDQGYGDTFNHTKHIISDIRATKTQAQKNMKYPVKEVTITAAEPIIERCKLAQEDIIRAGSIEKLTFINDTKQESLTTAVELAPEAVT